MEIVDSQVHVNQLATEWRNAAPDPIIDTAIMMMDAVGISAALIDEAGGFDGQHRHLPSYELPNGSIRSLYPFSDRAIARHPTRFGLIARVDPDDPELDSVMADVRARPGGVCLRIVPQPDNGEFDHLLNGGFEPLFDAAQRHGVPILAWLPGRSYALVRYLRDFPQVPVVLDHTGVGNVAPDERDRQFQQVLDLSRFPNFGLKWCHAPQRFSRQAYPFSDVMPYLRQAIDALGVERIMWASDHTQSKSHHTWAEALYSIRDAAELSVTEKEWLLGKTARTMLRWR